MKIFPKSSNEKISTPVGIIVILFFALLFGGFLIWQCKIMPEETKMPEIEGPERQTEDETANWETYRNERIGFETKRLENWEVDEIKEEEWAGEKSNRVIFWLPNEDVYVHEDLTLSVGVSIEVEKRTKEKKYKDINDYLDEWKSTDPGIQEYFSVTRDIVDLGFVEINGVNFYKYSWTHQAQGLAYLAVKNGDLIGILFRIESDLLPTEEFSGYFQFEQFLSTFRFLEQ